MVVFTCGYCGESIKKPSIAKHYMGKCRGPPNVTCVDCLKDFRGNEYEAHIKCVTEDERYAAKGFVPKPSSNKGEKKQQTWFEAVQRILESDKQLKPDERELLTVLSAHENLPRKKGKFMNFLANAHRQYAKRQNLVERVWSIIEEAGKAATGNSTTSNGFKSDEGIIEKPNIQEVDDYQDIEKDKKPKRKEKLANGSEKLNEKSDDIKSTKKSKRKGDGIDSEDSKKRKLDESKNIIRDILTEGGGSLSWYKLNQALEKHCADLGGVERAAKMLKKVQKQVTVHLEGERIILDTDALK